MHDVEAKQRCCNTEDAYMEELLLSSQPALESTIDRCTMLAVVVVGKTLEFLQEK